MSDITRNNAQLAEISIVKSTDIMTDLSDQNQLITYYNQIQDAKDRTLAVKAVLERTPVFGVTQTFGTLMDKELQSIGVMDVVGDDVEGVESLGRTLMPSQYLKTRISGCESFLSILMKSSSSILTTLVDRVRDRYILMVETNKTLQRRLQQLNSDLRRAPTRKHGAGTITIKSNPLLFAVNGEIREDWGTQLERVDKTITALIKNYYQANRFSINELVAYFSGFDKLEEKEALARFLTLPTQLPTHVFKECMYLDRAESNAVFKVRHSVELMGGRRFTNTLLAEKAENAKLSKDVIHWIESRYMKEGVTFDRAERHDTELPVEIPSLGTLEIQAGVVLIERILKATEVIFSEGDRYTLLGDDYLDILRLINDTTWNDQLKFTVASAFERVAMKFNQEMLDNRSRTVAYLTLLINGFINLAYDSIDVK